MIGIAILFNIIILVMILVFLYTFCVVCKYYKDSKKFLAEDKKGQPPKEENHNKNN